MAVYGYTNYPLASLFYLFCVVSKMPKGRTKVVCQKGQQHLLLIELLPFGKMQTNMCVFLVRVRQGHNNLLIVVTKTHSPAIWLAKSEAKGKILIESLKNSGEKPTTVL